MPKDVVATNLKALMDAHPDLDTLEKITDANGGSNGTLDRIRRGESYCRINALARLAGVFGLEAWQLLVPRLDSYNLPKLEMDSQVAQELKNELEAIAKTILKKNH